MSLQPAAAKALHSLASAEAFDCSTAASPPIAMTSVHESKQLVAAGTRVQSASVVQARFASIATCTLCRAASALWVQLAPPPVALLGICAGSALHAASPRMQKKRRIIPPRLDDEPRTSPVRIRALVEPSACTAKKRHDFEPLSRG